MFPQRPSQSYINGSEDACCVCSSFHPTTLALDYKNPAAFFQLHQFLISESLPLEEYAVSKQSGYSDANTEMAIS